MKKNRVDDFVMNLVIIAAIALGAALVIYIIKKPAKPGVDVSAIMEQAKLDSASAVYYSIKAKELEIYADSIKAVAKNELRLRIERDREIYALKKKEAKTASPEASVLAFLKTTDSAFVGPAPSGIIRGADTLFEINTMNIREANWIFCDLEEERNLTMALLDYQTILLNAYDTLSMSADKSALSSLKWEAAYQAALSSGMILSNDKAALEVKNKRLKRWAWTSTGVAVAAAFAIIF